MRVGEFIAIVVAAAQRDPRAYGDPSFRLDAERPATLSFGGGVHHCLGHALARMELEEALLALTRRYRAPGARRAGRVAVASRYLRPDLGAGAADPAVSTAT